MALEKGLLRWLRSLSLQGGHHRENRILMTGETAISPVRFSQGKETRVQVEDITLDGMTFRVVSPPKSNGLLPTIIYYHGGCFVSGGFATHDNQLRQLAWFSGCRVIAVQYRLAPEHTFPAAHDDAEQGAHDYPPARGAAWR
jgi:acetyl esterase